MFDVSIGVDGKIYLTGIYQSPYQHLPGTMTVCLQDEIEKVVRKVLTEQPTDPRKDAGA